MKRLAMMTGAALIALSGTAIAQVAGNSPPAEAATAPEAPATPAPPATPEPGASTGSDVGARSTPGTAGDTPTPASEAAATGTPAASAVPPTPPVPPAEPAPPPADTAATTGAPAPAGAAADVQGKWATYDKDGSGGLNPLEFGTWILAAQGNDLTRQVEKTRTSKKANLPAIKVLNATAGEFSKADKDKDRAVSQAELSTYLAS